MIRRNSFRGGSSGLGSTQKITVRLLDDNEVLQLDFQTQQKAQTLMDYVCRKLNVAEKDYFGLRYVDGQKQRHWMDLGKSITKQLKDMTPLIVCFRFKFYPGDPELLKEQVTKYQLVLQLRRDLLHGRLYSTLPEMATLASYIVQSELGDYNASTHIGNYVSEYELIARQSAEFEEKVKELHEKLIGTTPAEADELFLKKAASLDTYGIDPHPVKDAGGEQLFLGINHTGISTFVGSRKNQHWKWNQISKLNYEAKMFIVHVSIPEDSRTKKKETFGFKCLSSGACKHLWRCAVEQRLFFNCGSGTEIGAVRGGGLFGSKFKYSGKVLKEILEDPGPLRATDSIIQRTPLYRSLQRNKIRSNSDSPLAHSGYCTLPRSNTHHSAPATGTGGVVDSPGTTCSDGGIAHLDLASSLASSGSLPINISGYCPDQTLPLPLLETLEEDSPRAEEKDLLTLSNSKTKSLDVGEGEESTSWVFEGGAGDADARSAAASEKSMRPSPPIPSAASGSDESGLAEAEPRSQSQGPSKPKSNSKPQPKLSRLPSIDEHEHEAEVNQPKKTELNNKNAVAAANANNNNNTSKTAATATAKKCFRKFGVSMAPDPLLISSSSSSASVDVNVAVPAAAAAASELPIPGRNPDDSEIPNFRGSSSNPNALPNSNNLNSTSGNANAHEKASAVVGGGNYGGTATPGRRLGLSIWRIFLVSMICVLVALVVVAIISIELDTEICQKIRKIPEIELFQAEVYDPFKGFVNTRLRSPFK